MDGRASTRRALQLRGTPQLNFSPRDDNPGRRSITEKMTSEEALQAAKTLARAEQGKFDSQ